VNIIRRINRALSRAGGSTVPAPGAGAMAAQVDLQEIEAVEEEEFPPEDQSQGDESE
jgi:hypothetical protein